jgi:hypothetical protein
MVPLKTKIISRLKFLKSNPLKNYVKKEPIYVFHHINKCGGTSLMYSLREWFFLVKDYKNSHLSQKISKPININNFRHFLCLSGHFHFPGIHLHERYPQVWQDSRFRVFTVLRDPLQVRISEYYFKIRTGRLTKDTSLEEDLLSHSNFIASRIPCTRKNYTDLGIY